MQTPWGLVPKHLKAHWVRSGLTVAALMVALFLLCFLISIVTALDQAVEESADNRLIVQSAVSLFVELPRDYQPKIASVPGVRRVSKFQWFGGYYRSFDEGFFAQFAVDQGVFFDMYDKDIEITLGPNGEVGPEARDAVVEAMAGERRGAVIGEGLARDYGWEIGSTITITGVVFQMADGTAWDFLCVGVYRPTKANMDDRTMFFRYDYVSEMLDGGLATGPKGVGAYSVDVSQGHDPAMVCDGIDRLFSNGPQVTKTTTEAAFQAIFVAMLGNLPLFVGTVGGAVVFAVLFSVVNTMLMAGRQRTPEVGILKALGFPNGAVSRLMMCESVLLSMTGGLLGVGLAVVTQEWMRQMLGQSFPAYQVTPGTVLTGLGVALAIGIIAGIAPAIMMARLKPTDALRSEG